MLARATVAAPSEVRTIEADPSEALIAALDPEVRAAIDDVGDLGRPAHRGHGLAL
jgi:hypothetical protein